MVDYTVALKLDNLSGPEWKKFTADARRADEEVKALGKPLPSPFGNLSAGANDVRSRIEGLIGTAKGFIGVAGALWAVNKVLDYGEGIHKAAAEMVQLASANNLTTNQVQALQDLAKRSGKTFEELAGTVGKNKLALDTLTQTFVATGQAIDTNVTAKVAEMERQSKESTERMDVHFNKVRAFVAELYIPAKSNVLDFAATSLDNVARAVTALDLGKLQNIMATLLNPALAIATVGQAVVNGDPVAAAQARVNALQSEYNALIAEGARLMAPPPPGSVMPHVAAEIEPTIQKAMDVSRKLDAARKELDKATRATWGGKAYTESGGPVGDPFGMFDPVTGAPKPVAVGAGAGGGGGGSRDRIGENLSLYEAQARASQKALEELMKVARQPLPLDDLEREIKLRKDIADAEAQAAKFARDDPRIAQLRQQITLRETAESGYRRFIDALKLADTTERQYGDGKLQFLQTENQLNDARNTGRLSLEAYGNAMKVLAMTTEDLRLKNLGLQGGFVGLAAGWENARIQNERANNMFATGGRIYDRVITDMVELTKHMDATFGQSLLNMGANWARFVADVAMREGASKLFGAAGGFSGILSWLTGGGGGSGAAQAAVAGGGWATGGVAGLLSAGGGPVRAGQPSIVGEFSPELWVPNTGGNVLNRQQLDALGVGGGGGDAIVVNMGGVTVGDLVTPAQLDRAMRITREAAIQGTTQALLAQGRHGVRSVKGALR